MLPISAATAQCLPCHRRQPTLSTATITRDRVRLMPPSLRQTVPPMHSTRTSTVGSASTTPLGACASLAATGAASVGLRSRLQRLEIQLTGRVCSALLHHVVAPALMAGKDACDQPAG